jgi:hypothetical protein
MSNTVGLLDFDLFLNTFISVAGFVLVFWWHNRVMVRLVSGTGWSLLVRFQHDIVIHDYSVVAALSMIRRVTVSEAICSFARSEFHLRRLS